MLFVVVPIGTKYDPPSWMFRGCTMILYISYRSSSLVLHGLCLPFFLWWWLRGCATSVLESDVCYSYSEGRMLFLLQCSLSLAMGWVGQECCFLLWCISFPQQQCIFLPKLGSFMLPHSIINGLNTALMLQFFHSQLNLVSKPVTRKMEVWLIRPVIDASLFYQQVPSLM